jgi:hypothetical protein
MVFIMTSSRMHIMYFDHIYLLALLPHLLLSPFSSLMVPLLLSCFSTKVEGDSLEVISTYDRKHAFVFLNLAYFV